MDKRVMENQHRPLCAFCRYQPATFNEIRDPRLVTNPERIACRFGIKTRTMFASLVGTWNEIKRAVEFRHIIQKYMQIERCRTRHPVLGVVGGEIVMPLPDLARKRGLNIDFDLLGWT